MYFGGTSARQEIQYSINCALLGFGQNENAPLVFVSKRNEVKGGKNLFCFRTKKQNTV
jgi:hypothetical protein